MSTMDREDGKLVEAWGVDIRCELRLHGMKTGSLVLWKLPPHNGARWTATVMATPAGMATLRTLLAPPSPVAEPAGEAQCDCAETGRGSVYFASDPGRCRTCDGRRPAPPPEVPPAVEFPCDPCGAPSVCQRFGVCVKKSKPAPAPGVPAACGTCRGGGVKRYSRSRENPYGDPCPDCNGTGRPTGTP